MKIINPIYDLAFKYLMENKRIAKKVLSVILDEEITDLELTSHETVITDKFRAFSAYRQDFKAVIRYPDGTEKMTLIELQKSKYPTDIQRFRNYLGSSYLSNKIISNAFVSENEITYGNKPYPIIAIYILGYILPEIPRMAVTVNNEVYDSVSHEKLNVKSEFIDKLHHRSHIIQIRRLPARQQSRLEKFMLLFNQEWRTDNNHILDLQKVPREFTDVARYLQAPVMDDAFRRSLVFEEEIDFIFDDQAHKHLVALREAIEEADEAKEQMENQKAIAQEERRQKEMEREQKQEERKQKEEERKHKELALEELKRARIKLAAMLKKSGMTLREISEETGLGEDEINSL